MYKNETFFFKKKILFNQKQIGKHIQKVVAMCVKYYSPRA